MKTLPDQVDVLIVGYGPVGAALANLLGELGVRTLVVDKASAIFMAPRAIALDNEALRILQMVGLEDGAFPRCEIPRVRFVNPWLGDVMALNTSGEIDAHPKLVTFYQPQLERALRERLASRAAVEVCTGLEFVSLERRAERIVCDLRDAEGARHQVRARYVVGADGASSRVRASVGGGFAGKTYPQAWLVIDAKGADPDFDHVEFICDPRRPTPHMVAPGGRTRWEFMLMPGETVEEMERDEAIDALLRPWGGLAKLEIERRAVYHFHARTSARFSHERVFLAGDAAHVTPPFVGQGLVAGLRDAANLAWKLAWVLEHGASPSILDSYDQERRPHAIKMINLARAAGWTVMPRSRLQAGLLHRAIELAQRLPGASGFIDELGLKPSNFFPRGLLVGGRGRGRRGSWFPQVRTRAPDGSVHRSDDLLGSSLAAVGGGGDPGAQLPPALARAWARAGGKTLGLQRGSIAPDRGCHAVLGDALSDRHLPPDWCVLLRPDKTVLHDGPLARAPELVKAGLDVLGLMSS
ncbi:bifunctional 3-(3-hydroxy-phenyl)propionate/3-hydroxycinnamic acid hydroxylase [Pseudenhygromyxa sp. WMMC2535]|uniref:bifunctional 3-(3-hydroxy-phenyl)propionate/3-hydroxycinnamic acid hydroxylase n=1 Tax=Pseudenhygromyxa sp. WMMC2535 TaxID=2712867 RepID=UPI001556E568|nr:bifunctional 3-(3-hydroxy-phenyl)propionate/3-hydroxycinnamic acid hydroxylase [Pseudenhygromyxa sp. WMMC2535]NVB41425.1 bifunctional 3-(3-hydroxy-phenyl)propionate/3-hydroxycinnamic acid hydroxylase [Pseudenhygromyxa sp. WMMC2535]